MSDMTQLTLSMLKLEGSGGIPSRKKMKIRLNSVTFLSLK